jgi:hypothetical protein
VVLHARAAAVRAPRSRTRDLSRFVTAARYERVPATAFRIH